ncbi:MAG TPA: hypothetical protein VKU00_26380, partial [Chthonomonadaceae bacterium]|nr:hypothetical protein [Chthonomonadaceae bacterium]
LNALPQGLQVTSWLDLANTGIRALPDSLAGVQLRWRDVLVDERVVLRPETITKEDVLGAPNAELRRVLMERMGFEKFMQQAKAEILNTDRDPGGERRLLHVPMLGDEDLVALSVFCPSTGRQYILRVPPNIKTCHQAAAWIAGFDNPNDYRPVMET